MDLEPGDVVLFASDGILESENAAQEEFGPATFDGTSFRLFLRKIPLARSLNASWLRRMAIAAPELLPTTIAHWSSCA